MSGDGDAGSACCAPTHRPATDSSDRRPVGPSSRGEAAGLHRIEQAVIPAQTFRMGDSRRDGFRSDGELPVHEVSIASFSMDATTVTNADFAAFVSDTGYSTDAETMGNSAVFHLALHPDDRDDVLHRDAAAPWWLWVRGASWAHPFGPSSTVDGIADHPVVHMSWNDAQAYCAWSGRSLPTEAQWEAASRGGLAEARYPWGDESDAARLNIWEGTFPAVSVGDWLTTAPVRSYQPNGYGLWQTVGNVWEWCSDWFDAASYRRATAASSVPAPDPRGPERGSARVLRGGSYLCHDSYCNRYRNSARSSNTPDSSMGNAGFRTVSKEPA